MLQTPIGEVQERLDLLGLSRGWGNTVGRCKSTVILMLELLQVCSVAASDWAVLRVDRPVYKHTD